MRNHFFIFTVFLCFITFKSDAKVISQLLVPELIFYSNNIVIGQITSVEDSTYTLSVLQTIKGQKHASYVLKKDTLDLKPSFRWNKYKVGQTELAFLTFNKDDNSWELTLSHGEAELLINNDTIYLYSPGWVLIKNIERYPFNKITINDVVFDGLPYNKNEMIQAVIDFNKQAKALSKKMSLEKDIIDAQDNNKPIKDDIVLTDKSLINFQNKSSSHKRLICELMDEPYLGPF